MGVTLFVVNSVNFRALIELGKTGAQNVAYGVVATLVNITNSYDKQEIDPQMVELAKFAKHHIPEEHELDDEDFADKRAGWGSPQRDREPQSTGAHRPCAECTV